MRPQEPVEPAFGALGKTEKQTHQNPNQESPELGLPWELAAGFQPGMKPLWVGESRLARLGLPLLRLTLDTGGKGTDGARLPYLVAKQVWLAWASR